MEDLNPEQEEGEFEQEGLGTRLRPKFKGSTTYPY